MSVFWASISWLMVVRGAVAFALFSRVLGAAGLPLNLTIEAKTWKPRRLRLQPQARSAHGLDWPYNAGTLAQGNYHRVHPYDEQQYDSPMPPQRPIASEPH